MRMTHRTVPDLSPAARTAAAILAPKGQLRVAINLGNPVLAQRDPATGALSGASVVLAIELAALLGVPLDLIPYDAAGAVVDALAEQAWDLAFLAIEPKRAETIAFSAPYVFIDGTYLVRNGDPFEDVDDLDRDGRRIIVGRGAAYDLFLSRTLQHAELVRVPTSAAAIEVFLKGDQTLDAAAGIRQALVDAARDRDDVHVLEDRFVRIEQGVAVPRARAAALPYIGEFLKEMILAGRIRDALDATGQDGARVADPPTG